MDYFSAVSAYSFLAPDLPDYPDFILLKTSN